MTEVRGHGAKTGILQSAEAGRDRLATPATTAAMAQHCRISCRTGELAVSASKNRVTRSPLEQRLVIRTMGALTTTDHQALREVVADTLG